MFAGRLTLKPLLILLPSPLGFFLLLLTSSRSSGGTGLLASRFPSENNLDNDVLLPPLLLDVVSSMARLRPDQP